MGKSSEDKGGRRRLRRKHTCLKYFGYDAGHILEVAGIPYDHQFVALQDQTEERIELLEQITQGRTYAPSLPVSRGRCTRMWRRNEAPGSGPGDATETNEPVAGCGGLEDRAGLEIGRGKHDRS